MNVRYLSDWNWTNWKLMSLKLVQQSQNYLKFVYTYHEQLHHYLLLVVCEGTL